MLCFNDNLAIAVIVLKLVFDIDFLNNVPEQMCASVFGKKAHL